jgi:hypothetical protein
MRINTSLTSMKQAGKSTGIELIRTSLARYSVRRNFTKSAAVGLLAERT